MKELRVKKLSEKRNANKNFAFNPFLLTFNFKRGNAWVGILILLVFVISLGLALMTEVMNTIIQSKRQEKILVAQTLCDAGIEKAFWKLNKTGGFYNGENGIDRISLATGDLDIFVTPIDPENKEILATAYVPSYTARDKVTRKVRARVRAQRNESGASFHYGVQVGGLGVIMSNNSKIIGNLYSDGNLSGGNGSEITGDAFVANNGNKIEGVKIGTDARAHSIIDALIGRDAYYYSNSTLQNSTVLGTKYPGSPNPPSIGLPLSQSTIDSWETWAAAGGEINSYILGTYATGTLGPKKINGDLILNTGATLNLTGALWVTGNIFFASNSVINLSSAYGPNSGMIIADSPIDKVNYGKIEISSNVSINGSGNPSSYIMMISTNHGSTIASPAIKAGNNSDAVVYYTTSGYIEVQNNAKLRAVSGGGLHLSNGAIVEYDSGLANANFSGGPGGSWQITEWQIVY